MTSRFFENAVEEYVLLNEGVEYNDIVLRRTLANFKDVIIRCKVQDLIRCTRMYMEKRNAAFLARGPGVLTNIQDPAERADPMTRIPEYIAQLKTDYGRSRW